MARRKKRFEKKSYRRVRRTNRRLRSTKTQNQKFFKVSPINYSLFATPKKTYYKPRPQPRKTTTITIGSNPQSPRRAKQSLPKFKTVLLNNPKLAICARRQQRKEILHANRHTGKSGQKRPTNNQYRNINCKG